MAGAYERWFPAVVIGGTAEVMSLNAYWKIYRWEDR